MDTAATSGHEAAPDADTFLMWVLVWSELVAFGILLVAFLVTGVVQHKEFGAARGHLQPLFAGLNTLVLLTSGWQAALAARAAASERDPRKPLVGAASLGMAFAVIKLTEYSREIGHAGDDAYGSFFELYFMITGFHLLHVVFVAAVLLVVAWRPSRSNITLVTTLWHLIDLVWLVMFPIIYLV